MTSEKPKKVEVSPKELLIKRKEAADKTMLSLHKQFEIEICYQHFMIHAYNEEPTHDTMMELCRIMAEFKDLYVAMRTVIRTREDSDKLLKKIQENKKTN